MKVVNKYNIKENEEEIKDIQYIKQNKIWDFCKSNLIFLIGIILLTFKAIFLNCLLGLDIQASTVLYTMLVCALIMSPTIGKNNKFAYIYLNIIYTIATIIIYANFLYYSYSTNFLSFYQIGNLKYAKDIGSGAACIINFQNLLMFWTDNVLIAILSAIAFKKSKHTNYNNKKLQLILTSIIIISNIFVVAKDINGIYKEKTYNKSLIVKDISIYYYHYEDAKEYFSNMFVKEKIDEERLKTAYQNNITNKEQSTKYTGIAKDKNVIILQLESLNDYIIGKTVNGKEIMPNLNKFFSENIYCSEMYNQGLGTTADSEFEMENSMYPLENGYVFQKYYNNKWNDIYKVLREEGYYTSFMHPNDSNYWNREEVYKKGYNIDEYNDINKFPFIEKAAGFYSDEGFFEEAVNIMSSYEGKFCTTLVSVTTHIPFELTGISNLEDKLTISYDDVLEYEDAIYKNYIISCNFVDYAFGKFIQGLEDKGIIDNSILVVYGDHGAGLTCIDDIKRIYQENGVEYTEFEDAIRDVHIPFAIKIPEVEDADTINRAVSKIDIKPTILDLLDVKDKFSIGNSIFSEKDYSFIKGLGFVTSKKYCLNDKYYNRDNLEEIEIDEETRKLLYKMEEEIYLSDTIIKNNLINQKGQSLLVEKVKSTKINDFNQ